MERLRQETLFDGLIGGHTRDDGFGTGDSMIQISIKPHADLTDVIEIHSSCERSTTTSRSSAMKLLSHHSKPPPESAPTLFQNWPRRQAYGWPMTHRVVVCDRFCAEAVLRGAHIFVKGILCADTGIEAGQIVAVYGYVGSDKTKPTQGSTLDQLDIRDTCLFLGLGMTHCDRLQFFSTAGGIGVSIASGGTDTPPIAHIGHPRGCSKLAIHRGRSCAGSTTGGYYLGHVLCPGWQNNSFGQFIKGKGIYCGV